MEISDETKTIHPKIVELSPYNRALTFPIYQSVKFVYANMEALLARTDSDFIYSRKMNPTVRHLEHTLASLQGTEDGIAVASGVGALSSLFLTYLDQNAHVILFYESYMPTRVMLRKHLAKFGVRHTMLHIDDLVGLERTLASIPTRLVVFESPTNPMLRVAPLRRITGLAQKYGAKSVLDATFSGFHQYRDCGVDLFVHSLTKYASGHGDVMGGIILGPKNSIAEIRDVSSEFGPVLDPHAAFLISRGMKTYHLRVQRQIETAYKIAQALERHPRIERVFYPGLQSHPDHILAKEQSSDFGSIVSFWLKPGISTTQFIDRLKIFSLAASVGSVESLVVPCALFFGLDLTESQREAAWINDRSIRLSIGIECSEDLWRDIEQALK